MNYLSLFDGMACGHIASQLAEIAVDSYDAYEIDKYAALTATHNFPDIVEHGDVFAEDFTKYRGKVDFLIGGSPCTFWSIAQTNNRETTASGFGWELFSQYVRALNEVQPDWFIYENNKSMSKAIRDSIRETFGFEEICINSALVSAQNRQRYYWVGKRNEDGTYSKVPVEQPEDRGILLKDIIIPAGQVPETAWYTCGVSSTGRVSGHIADLEIKGNDMLKRVYSLDCKSPTLTTVGGGHTEKKVMQVGSPRKLLPKEYARLQTVPEWYDFSCVSATQAYKMLGNGWTCEVIAHLMRACIKEAASHVH